MRPGRTQVYLLPSEEAVSRSFRSGVSLHSHTEHSQERLGTLPRYLQGMPVISQFTKWEIERSRRKNAFPAASIFSARSSTAATWPRSTPTATRSSIPTRGSRLGLLRSKPWSLASRRRAPVGRRALLCERRQFLAGGTLWGVLRGRCSAGLRAGGRPAHQSRRGAAHGGGVQLVTRYSALLSALRRLVRAARQRSRALFSRNAGARAYRPDHNLSMPSWSKPTTTRPPATTIGRRIRLGSEAISRIASRREGGRSFIFFRR